MFYYTYVLRSLKDCQNYNGFTKNLDLRLKQHNDWEVQSTKHHRPLQLIYFEACLNERDAKRREKYFKTHYGRMFIKKRLKNWLSDG